VNSALQSAPSRALGRRLWESTLFRRSLAIVFHLAGIALAHFSAYLLRFDFNIPGRQLVNFEARVAILFGCYVLCVFVFGLHRGMWRFFTLRDAVVTAIAFGVGTLLAAAAIYAVNGYSFDGVSRSVLIVTYLLLLAWEMGGRGFARLLRENTLRSGGEGRILVFGRPEEADVLLRSLQPQGTSSGRVVGIVSDDPRHKGAKLRGVRVHSSADSIPELVRNLSATTILFLPPFTAPQRIREVVDALAESKLKCDYRVVPSLEEIASGLVDVSAIRTVAIEDLLPRLPYEAATDRLEGMIAGRRILVTGAGGSIGSEICRQVLKHRPAALVLYELSEFHLFEIERELAPVAAKAGVALVAVAGDVKRGEQLRSVIRGAGGIDVLYHAAAYKHVDLMERNAAACFQNNVVGTHVAAKVAEEEGVGDFVLVSTDKAVRPTSLMGASKRLAERVVVERPACAEGCRTRFKAVRFGNVLGSNGSVIPIFREQIARGGPVTVTSPKVTRFFMTIPEAVELVLTAGAIEEDRRIFVLEMGEPVRIDDMARRMIELSGFVPDVEIPVVYTGLKKGEKEYEELLTDDEDVVRTDLDRIWVVRKSGLEEVEAVDLGRLLELVDEGDEAGLRAYAHSLIGGSRLLPPSEGAGVGEPATAAEPAEAP
jgi:FlaA1/EpsC-like NDP-sugar epimerase